jgi:ferredoxin-NADP reductase
MTESLSGCDKQLALRAGLRSANLRHHRETVAGLDRTWPAASWAPDTVAGSSFIDSCVRSPYNLNSDEMQHEHHGCVVSSVSAARRPPGRRTNVVAVRVRPVSAGPRPLLTTAGSHHGVMPDAEAARPAAHQGGLRVRHSETIPSWCRPSAGDADDQAVHAQVGRWRELPPFSGGSHVVVVMPGPGRTYRNPYSLMSSPWDLSHYQIAVRRHDQGRGGSLFMHQQVGVGTRLEISHPVNLFPLAKLARKHILVAGGVGITPILAMIGDLRGSKVAWELHYAVRGPGHDHFGQELAGRHGDRIHLYHASAGQAPDFDRVLAGQPLGTHVYTCGPAGMIDAVATAARAAGWPGAYPLRQFTARRRAAEVYLARSGLTVHVPAERSLLEAIEAAGVDVPYLCRGGACGQCETAVLQLQGELIHNDHWLTDEDKASGLKIMPCVSRARCTRLVLDL